MKSPTVFRKNVNDQFNRNTAYGSVLWQMRLVYKSCLRQTSDDTAYMYVNPELAPGELKSLKMLTGWRTVSPLFLWYTILGGRNGESPITRKGKMVKTGLSHFTVIFNSILFRMTANSDFFMRVFIIFSRSFVYAKFREKKPSRNGEIIQSFPDVG